MNQLETIIELYKDGLTTREIGKELNLGKTTVWNRLHKAGIPRSVKYDRIVSLYQRGLSSFEVAIEVGIRASSEQKDRCLNKALTFLVIPRRVLNACEWYMLPRRRRTFHCFTLPSTKVYIGYNCPSISCRAKLATCLIPAT